MKPMSTLAVLALLAACTAADDGDPRTQLERNLDIPVELAGRIHPARLAYLKQVEEQDEFYSDTEQAIIRRQVLSGHKGLLLEF